MRTANSLKTGSYRIIKDNPKNSTERLKELFATIFVNHLTAQEQRDYGREILKHRTYTKKDPQIKKYYDYYELFKWPEALEKIHILEKKYRIIE